MTAAGGIHLVILFQPALEFFSVYFDFMVYSIPIRVILEQHTPPPSLVSRPIMKNHQKFLLRPRHGFSIVELLAVVGILALLIAIVLPALKRAHSKAKDTVCSVELRSNGELVTQYSTDHRGYLPFIYTLRSDDGRWITPNGVEVPEGFLETAGDFWVYPMLEEFGNDYFSDALLCPYDWVSRAQSEEIASERGVSVEQVRLPLKRSISRTFYKSPMSLVADGIVEDEQRMKLTDVRFPSSKAMLIEDPPFHDAFRVSEIWNIHAKLPYRNMIVAADLSVELRSLADALPGVLPTLDVPPTYIGNPDDYLAFQRMTSAYHRTRDGVLGRDWR